MLHLRDCEVYKNVFTVIQFIFVSKNKKIEVSEQMKYVAATKVCSTCSISDKQNNKVFQTAHQIHYAVYSWNLLSDVTQQLLMAVILEAYDYVQVFQLSSICDMPPHIRVISSLLTMSQPFPSVIADGGFGDGKLSV